MFKQLFDLVRGALLLQRDVQANRDNIAEVSRELDETQVRVEGLTLKLQEERHEREKLALRLENVLLRFERRLPPPPGKSNADN